ncbi:Cof-type HAD-IIB family hydrolase [Anaerosinus gibii]|uniref:Cof-type HAD-IIB family hydrolase n=1 Tax=Selenobaculum gibii TaxID=3054208 RepID=A0A9Y2ETQ7_9FIRM|nr:Cof-type HAD-IIB family hydrolase [Selenobaculum gbiensis]WIW70325.1 Cof-type HAD-IIB family hydrolase [Selenobaculum gbiensis]
MAIKLLVTDLDGTLLNGEKKISSRNALAIQRAQEKGVKVTFATGRMHKAAVRFAQEVNLDLPIISCNGSVIKSCDGKTIFEHHIDDKIAREAIEFCLENNWHIQWYIDDELYVNEIKPDLWTGYENVFKIDVKEAKGQLDKYSRRIVQMVILDKAGHIQSIAPKVRDRFTGRLDTPITSDHCIDVVSIGMNKAKGIEVLAREYGIRPSEIMVVGDSDNDLAMFGYAGFSVAMGNAFESIKAVADAITDDVEADGFATAVEKYILGD